MTASAAFWSSQGATAPMVAELGDACGNRFAFADLPGQYPLEDEPSAVSWAEWLARDREGSVYQRLRERLVELQFPIRTGISESELYRAVTRRGQRHPDPDADGGLALIDPAGLKLWIQQTPAGRIPIIQTARRDDFVKLVQALTRRNEPLPVPAAMGACIVSGYNDWGRIEALRRDWEQGREADPSLAPWSDRFKELARQPALFQARFILLSSGAYSAVAAEQVGLSSAEWERKSAIIRREHECTHYFTRRVLGSMRNAPGDEIIADYMGLVESEGRYRADWFLRFMGLEEFPRYRTGGRLESYRGDPPLSEGAFSVMQSTVKRAAHNLEVIDAIRMERGGLWTVAAKARLIIALARLGLEGLAAAGAGERFVRVLGM